MQIQNFEKKTSHTFEFEKIFDPSKKQADVFLEISDLVVSVLDGFSTSAEGLSVGQRTGQGGTRARCVRRSFLLRASHCCRHLIFVAGSVAVCLSLFFSRHVHLRLWTDGQWPCSMRAQCHSSSFAIKRAHVWFCMSVVSQCSPFSPCVRAWLVILLLSFCCCLFGVQGSGKTYTMQGTPRREAKEREEPGASQRATRRSHAVYFISSLDAFCCSQVRRRIPV